MADSELQLFSHPAASPKQAFRSAELLLSDLSFRDELRDLRGAAERIRSGFGSDTPPGAAIYLKDGFAFRRLDEIHAPEAPAALGIEETNLLRQEVSAYGMDGGNAAIWNVGGRREWV